MSLDIDKIYEECKKIGLSGEKNLWLENVSRGIIDIDTVLQQIYMNKEAKVLEVHKTAITELDSGRWQTTVKDDSKKSGRREIKLSTYEKVIDRLYDFYYFNKSFGEISKRLLYFSQDRIKEFSHFWCAFRIDPQEIKEWKDSIILANIDDD